MDYDRFLEISRGYADELRLWVFGERILGALRLRPRRQSSCRRRSRYVQTGRVLA